MLRPQDELHLMELHPQEHAALAGIFRSDKRVHVHKRDGLEGVLALSPPRHRRGLVLVDPSYEIKTEYESIPAFAEKLLRKWPEACLLIWAPMLKARRHEAMLTALEKNIPRPAPLQKRVGRRGHVRLGHGRNQSSLRCIILTSLLVPA